MKAIYTAKSANVKTGNIPQQVVGESYAETRESCTGCPLLNHTKDDKSSSDKISKFGLSCYSHYGRVRMGVQGTYKAHASGKDYSLRNALAKRAKTARFVRFGMIGDPSAINDADLWKDETIIRNEGLGILSYTHFWRDRGKHLKGRAMASCDTWQDVKDAVKAGWRAAVHVDSVEGDTGKFDGIKWVKCMYQRDSKPKTCNECGLCDASKAKGIDCIVFINH